MVTVEDVFVNANCSDHPLQIDEKVLEGVRTIAGLGGCGCTGMNERYDTCGSYCDSGSFAIGELKDGRFIVVREDSDSSGHGCQCSGSADIFDNIDLALRLGLTENEREALAANGTVRE